MRAFTITAPFTPVAELPREFGLVVSGAHSDFDGDGGLPQRCAS